MQTQVAVVGAGVAGLNVARLLHGSGVRVVVLEARPRPGGRVLTVDAGGEPSDDGFDLGPSWIWPRAQPAVDGLVHELGLATFGQQSEGDVVFERMSREPAQRYAGLPGESHTSRLVGGVGSLVEGLSRTLPGGTVRLGTAVTHLGLTEDGVELSTTGDGRTGTVAAEQVVAALPPRLLEATVDLSPALPGTTAELWRSTPTWMAPHAKFFAVYDEPFWLGAGLSGTAQSMVGPMLEIHDATTSSGRPALFGFLGVGAAERARLGREPLTTACLGQLARLFGERAGAPVATLYKDWAADPWCATSEDLVSSGHPAASGTWVSGPWSARLSLAGSETSAHEAGYLAGAVEASTTVAAEVLRRLDGRR